MSQRSITLIKLYSGLLLSPLFPKEKQTSWVATLRERREGRGENAEETQRETWKERGRDAEGTQKRRGGERGV